MLVFITWLKTEGNFLSKFFNVDFKSPWAGLAFLLVLFVPCLKGDTTCALELGCVESLWCIFCLLQDCLVSAVNKGTMTILQQTQSVSVLIFRWLSKSPFLTAFLKYSHSVRWCGDTLWLETTIKLFKSFQTREGTGTQESRMGQNT